MNKLLWNLGILRVSPKGEVGLFQSDPFRWKSVQVIERSLILEAGLEDNGTLRMFLFPCFLTHSLLFFLLGIAVTNKSMWIS